MTTLILIRHGETHWNVIGRYQGQADPPLNAKGQKQAKQVAQALNAKTQIDVLFTSPLRRAIQTAEKIAETLDIPLHADPRLMEIHQGDWQTKLRTEIEAAYPDLFRRWETEPWEVTPPGGEHLTQVQTRVYAAADEIINRFPNQRVGLVIHRIPIALLKMRYQGLEPDIVRTIHLPNTYWEAITVNEN
jgi:broad specificity phosphatase PhoE